MFRSALNVTIPIVVVGLLASVWLYFLLVNGPQEEAVRGAEQKAMGLARVLSHMVRPGLEFEDQTALQRDLQAASAESSTRYVLVRREDGRALANLGGAQVPGLNHLRMGDGGMEMSEDILHVVVPVLGQDRPLGWLQAGYSLEDLNASNARTRSRALTVTGALFFLALGTALFMGRSVANQNRLVGEISRTSSTLRAAAGHILSACNEQAVSTTEQAAAVEETRRTMGSLLEAASRIADSSQNVFQDAEQTSQTTRSLSDAIQQLAGQAQKITEISDVIRSISDKSDLLALNAALEGTKAGEAGRGFALVAAEMRRLAETVTGAAREIKSLSAAMESSSDNSVQAVNQSRDLAARTADSAREITLVTVQQRNSTEQVSSSMDEVTTLLARSAESTRGTEHSARELDRVALEMNQLTERLLKRGRG